MLDSRKYCRDLIVKGDTPQIKAKAKELFDSVTREIDGAEKNYKERVELYERMNMLMIKMLKMTRDVNQRQQIMQTLNENNIELDRNSKIVRAIEEFKKAEAPPIPPRSVTYKKDSMNAVKKDKEHDLKPVMPNRKPPTKPGS